MSHQKHNILIGTGTDRILAATVDLSDGSFTFQRSIESGKGSTWIHLLPDGTTMVAVNEFEDKLQIFQQQQQQQWKLLKTTSAHGTTPCFITSLGPLASNPEAPTLLALANYAWNDEMMEGDSNTRKVSPSSKPSFVVFSAAAGAKPESVLDKIVLAGDSAGDTCGPQKDRQESSHPHHCCFDPSGAFLLVPDLGTDTIIIAKVNRGGGENASVKSVSKIKTAPNTGPRHMIFHPTIPGVVFVLGELSCTLEVYEFKRSDDGERATMEHRQSVSCLPPGKTPLDFGGELRKSAEPGEDPKGNTCASINVAPNGNFVYCTNRGRNSVVGFKLSNSGEVAGLVGEFPSMGRTPRFAFFVGLRFLVANQDSDNIAAMDWNSETGALVVMSVTGGGNDCPIRSPQCIVVV